MRTFKKNIATLFKQVTPEESDTKFAVTNDVKIEINRICVKYIEHVRNIANLARIRDGNKRLMTRHISYAFRVLEQDISTIDDIIIEYTARRYLPMYQNNRRETKIGLVISVSHCDRIMREGGYSKIDTLVPIYLAYMVEMLCRQLLPTHDELVSMHDMTKRKRYNVREFMININDETRASAKSVLDKIGVVIYTGGLVPYLPDEFTQKKKYIAKKNDSDEPKKHRYRPGTVAVRNIKKYQKNGKLLMRLHPFQEHSRELVEFELEKKARFNENALHLLQKYIEYRTAVVVREAQKVVLMNSREGCTGRDLEQTYFLMTGKELEYTPMDPKFKNGLTRICFRAGVKRRGTDMIEYTGFVVNAFLHEIVVTISEYIRDKTSGTTVTTDMMSWAIDLCLSR